MTEGTPFRATDPYDWHAILTLIQYEFAYMQGRIDPPSSMHGLTEALIAEQARLGEVWVIEDNGSAVACVFLSPKPNAMYIGKLAVAATHRGRGLARVLVAVAETRARDLALPVLMLQTRVELTENHATFNALGFAITGTTSHEGFDRPTSITMEREVPAR
ncbi:MAG: GNAT family N-acetyltransferase [Maritimibacter sp.]|nr:GNAT family N-acetyltransferase [Maritimibacter sp.]